MPPNSPSPSTFSPYQKFVLAMLAFLQFTIILDFMIMSPLGAILMPALKITPSQFGLAVSAYAFSAGLAGILTAGFADKYDRKKLLLFFYIGFVFGTFLCAISPSYWFLMGSRIFTGIFGGVIGSISMAILADVFPMAMRGRVMGFIQSAFSVAQIMGLPLGLFLGNHFGWHSAFIMIVVLSTICGFLIFFKLQPITEHLKLQRNPNPISHLFKTVSKGAYLQTFLATTLLATGGFMIMPFASAFSVNNLKINLEQLPWVYLATGLSSMIVGPFLGKFTDKIGKFPSFCIGSLAGMVIVIYYCNLGATPLAGVIAINIILFVAINMRMISSQALASGVPDLHDRGAFMAVNNSVAQFSGGVAATIAGLIVVQTPGGHLGNYNILGYVVAGAMLISIGLMYPIHKMIMQKSTAPKSNL